MISSEPITWCHYECQNMKQEVVAEELGHRSQDFWSVTIDGVLQCSIITLDFEGKVMHGRKNTLLQMKHTYSISKLGEY